MISTSKPFDNANSPNKASGDRRFYHQQNTFNRSGYNGKGCFLDCFMNIILERETPPLYQDSTGTIRVGNSRVLLELVIRAFQDGLSPESIVSRYSSLTLSDVYNAIGYYLRHQQMVETYLQEREQLAESVQARFTDIQPDLQMIRSRLLSQHQF